MNEAGTINVKRLQVLLDEMAIWERDVFEKEFADLNWYKGKQITGGGKGGDGGRRGKGKPVVESVNVNANANAQEGLGAFIHCLRFSSWCLMDVLSAQSS